MPLLNFKGVVIRTTDTGEGDRVLTLIAAGIGRISVYAGGVRKTRSRSSAATDVFTYSDFSVYAQSGKYRLNTAELIESFYTLRTDITAMTYASHCAEIAYDLVQEEQEADDIMLLFLNTLYLLSGGANPALTTACYELKSACLAGFAPQMSTCSSCGKKLSCEPYFFSCDELSGVCPECAEGMPGLIRLGEGCVRAMRYVESCPPRKTFSFRLDKPAEEQFTKVCRAIIQKVNEKEYHKLDYLTKLQVNT